MKRRVEAVWRYQIGVSNLSFIGVSNLSFIGVSNLSCIGVSNLSYIGVSKLFYIGVSKLSFITVFNLFHQFISSFKCRSLQTQPKSVNQNCLYGFI